MLVWLAWFVASHFGARLPFLPIPLWTGAASLIPALQSRWVTWGNAIAGAVCLIGSLILSWYVANFGSYNATYGSLGAVIGFLIWMWLSTIIVLGGAAFKHVARASVAIPFVLALGFAVSAVAAMLIDRFGHVAGYGLMAAGLAALGVVAALVFTHKEHEVEKADEHAEAIDTVAASKARTRVR